MQEFFKGHNTGTKPRATKSNKMQPSAAKVSQKQHKQTDCDQVTIPIPFPIP